PASGSRNEHVSSFYAHEAVTVVIGPVEDQVFDREQFGVARGGGKHACERVALREVYRLGPVIHDCVVLVRVPELVVPHHGNHRTGTDAQAHVVAGEDVAI